MNRRNLLKSLTLLPLTGAAAITLIPNEAQAQKKQKGQWTPKKQVVRKSNSGGNTNTAVTRRRECRRVYYQVVSGRATCYSSLVSEAGIPKGEQNQEISRCRSRAYSIPLREYLRAPVRRCRTH